MYGVVYDCNRTVKYPIRLGKNGSRPCALEGERTEWLLVDQVHCTGYMFECGPYCIVRCSYGYLVVDYYFSYDLRKMMYWVHPRDSCDIIDFRDTSESPYQLWSVLPVWIILLLFYYGVVVPDLDDTARCILIYCSTLFFYCCTR